jgi:hypothetical protein
MGQRSRRAARIVHTSMEPRYVMMTDAQEMCRPWEGARRRGTACGRRSRRDLPADSATSGPLAGLPGSAPVALMMALVARTPLAQRLTRSAGTRPRMLEIPPMILTLARIPATAIGTKRPSMRRGPTVGRRPHSRCLVCRPCPVCARRSANCLSRCLPAPASSARAYGVARARRPTRDRVRRLTRRSRAPLKPRAGLATLRTAHGCWTPRRTKRTPPGCSTRRPRNTQGRTRARSRPRRRRTPPRRGRHHHQRRRYGPRASGLPAPIALACRRKRPPTR